MACSYMLFVSVLLLALSNSVLGAGHHKHKHTHAHAPAPSQLVAATPALAPVEATPAPVESTPSPTESTPAPVEAPSPAFDLAPAEGPSDSEDDVCSAYTAQLLECLDYIEEGSSTATPGNSCCDGLRSMASGDVRCLCAVLGGSDDSMGFPINVSRVMTLPYTCKFILPTTSKCNALLGGTTVATAPVQSASQGAADITSPPLPAQSRALALPVAVFTVAAGVVVSMLSLIA